tara:strand:+ start:362 stop:1066 length:705 start_codon:yes stop_codon:yes gene_type:complete
MDLQQQIDNFIKNLKEGVCAALTVRKVNSNDPTIDNFQLEVAERVNTGQRMTNMLGILNASDPRFNNRGARRVFSLIKATELLNMFPKHLTEETLNALEIGGEPMFLGVENPSINHLGQELFLRIRINETFEGDEWDLANLDKSAKKKGRDGDFIYGNNNGELSHIFSKTELAAATYNAETDEFENVDDWTHNMIAEATEDDIEYNPLNKIVSSKEVVNTVTGEIKPVDTLPKL